MLQHDSRRFHISSQPSDQGLSAVFRSCLGGNLRRSRLLYIKTPFLAQHDSQHVFCLHSPQTEVRPLCAKTLGSLSTTLSIVICLRNPQTGVCLLHAEVSSWSQPSVLPSVASQEFSMCPRRLLALPCVFKALRPQSVHLYWDLYFSWHDPWCSHSSS